MVTQTEIRELIRFISIKLSDDFQKEVEGAQDKWLEFNDLLLLYKTRSGFIKLDELNEKILKMKEELNYWLFLTCLPDNCPQARKDTIESFFGRLLSGR